MTAGFQQLERELIAAERRARRSRPPARPALWAARTLVPTIGVVVALVVAGIVLLTGSATPSRTTAAQPPGPRAITPGRDSGARTLPCGEAVGGQAPTRDVPVILGVVALPAAPPTRRALQTALTGSGTPAMRLFAKWGLVIRAGSRFRLIVPGPVRGRLRIGWGNAGENHEGTTITVDGCRATGARWIDFAGGYWVARTMCAPLIVEANGRRQQVHIGIGQACPGQLPPPQPTQR